MDDLISRAAAIEAIVSLTAFESEDELKKFVEEKACDDYYLGGLYDAIDEIKDTTVVDAAPVVRCRDCKYGKLCFDADGQGLIQCTNPYYQTSFAETWPFDLDWYCAGGERRDDDGKAD